MTEPFPRAQGNGLTGGGTAVQRYKRTPPIHSILVKWAELNKRTTSIDLGKESSVCSGNGPKSTAKKGCRIWHYKTFRGEYAQQCAKRNKE